LSDPIIAILSLHKRQPRQPSVGGILALPLEARYPDETRSFRKKCTEDFTRVELEKIKEVYQWLSRLIP
jgi:hypothetical protein